MKNYFAYYQKRKSQCNFFQYFKIPLANYDNSGKCVLEEAQKKSIIILNVPYVI